MNFKFNNKKYRLIVLNVSGSRLYGNSTETSDYDYRGVFIADASMHISLNENVEQLGGQTGKGASGEQLCQALLDAGIDIEFTDDIVLYELRRFIDLSLDANPNILDILCHDYKSAANIYINDLGKILLDNKDLFISKKLKHTFSGYAFAQLKKIKSHNKWIGEFPHTSKIIEILKYAFKEDENIDFDFIVQNFGGPLAEEITNQTAQEHTTIDNCLSWEEFYNSYSITECDLNQYRLPRLYDYTKTFDLKAKQLNKDEVIKLNIEDKLTSDSVYTTDTIKTLLLKNGSFRQLGGSILSLFTEGTGIFDLGGNVKNHPPKKVGDFVCIVILDKNEYKKNTDHINNMWNWKIKRNKDRAVLEDEFGYDTKHASHLIRLLLSSKELLKTGNYIPELSGDILQMVKDVRAGKYEYEYIIKFSNELENELNMFYNSKDCKLPQKPNRVKANNLLLEMVEIHEHN